VSSHQSRQILHVWHIIIWSLGLSVALLALGRTAPCALWRFGIWQTASSVSVVWSFTLSLSKSATQNAFSPLCSFVTGVFVSHTTRAQAAIRLNRSLWPRNFVQSERARARGAHPRLQLHVGQIDICPVATDDMPRTKNPHPIAHKHETDQHPSHRGRTIKLGSTERRFSDPCSALKVKRSFIWT